MKEEPWLPRGERRGDLRDGVADEDEGRGKFTDDEPGTG
jgi:hypothetical protein